MAEAGVMTLQLIYWWYVVPAAYGVLGNNTVRGRS